MTRRLPNRSRQKQQIQLLKVNTKQRNSRKQLGHYGLWAGVVLAMIVAVGAAIHIALDLLTQHMLYDNPHYALRKIEIEPDRFTPYAIRQAAGLEPGQNLWTLNLPEITHDVEKLPYVSSAKVERHFPDRLVIHIHERVPLVKIVGINVDLGRRETFYLDRDCIVLKPREDEPPPSPPLPEVIGLTNAELEPGVRLDDTALTHALEILDAIKNTSTLNTAIDIRTINLSEPLCIKMETTQGMIITFRPDSISQQLARLDAIFERYGNDSRPIHTVDLTPERNVPITFYE